MRIGGEFELLPSMLNVSPSTSAWPAPAMPHGIWLDTGRSALFVAASIARAKGVRRAFLPAYICETAVDPFVSAGLEVLFYGGLPFAEIVPPRELGRDDLFLFAHYFGVDTCSGRTAAEVARQRGALIIEDRVQSSLSDGIPTVGDFAVTSLRKFTASPDGAYLGSLAPIDWPCSVALEGVITSRILGKMLRGANRPHTEFMPLLAESEGALLPNIPRVPSRAGTEILARTDFVEIGQRRQTNWRFLDGLLTQTLAAGHLTRLMPEPVTNEIPLGYPVLVAKGLRGPLARTLKSREIYCPQHWPLDHLAKYASRKTASFPAEQECSSSVLTFPIDQRYEALDMERIAAACKDFFE